MRALSLLAAVFVVTVDQFVQWKYGPAGIAGLLLLTIGVRAHNATCSSLGAVVLALSITGPAL
ncbi:hypothetical protein [Streptomyces sp. NPDC059009]|uniref:hypothetical protein n=1 Tax=Streptomyces sp. NPDC059009 TaxID=3346694 RepID=UPI0036AEBB1A